MTRKININNLDIKKIKTLFNNVKQIKISKDIQVIFIGNIDENIIYLKNKLKKILLKNESYKELSNFNGQYLFFIKFNPEKKIVICNSNFSYYSLFYTQGKEIFISNNILDLKTKKSKLNLQNVYEWLMLSGRSITNETKIKNIYNLIPGETLIIKDKVIEIIKKKFMYYEPDPKIDPKYLSNLFHKIINKFLFKKKNVLLALTGGLDSRILACSVNKQNKKKIISYTYGDGYNFEKLIANLVSNESGFLKHININIKDKDYFPIQNRSLIESNFDSTFQHQYQIKLFEKIKKRTSTKNVILGCALDQFLGSSFSNKNLLKINSKKDFLKWFEKKYFIFSDKDINHLIGHNTKNLKKKLKENLMKIIDQIKYKNYFDLNDSLQFEIRIIRWYNRNLVYIAKNLNIFAPTYDKKFILNAFKIPSKLRQNSFFRKKLLENLNLNLSKIIDSNNLLPGNYNGKLNDIFEKKINELDFLIKKDNIDFKFDTKSFLYDVNFGSKFTYSLNFRKYLKNLSSNTKNKKNISQYINTILKKNRKHNNKYLKKIIFSISYLEILKNINI